MDIAELITADRIILDLRVRDKGQLLQELARRAAALAGSVGADTVLAALQSREALGSTGLGKGFALPHARVEALAGFVGLFVRLARPIEYEAIDGAPVDLVFLLLMPTDAESAQVATLAAISRHFRNGDTMARVRRADAAAVLALLTAAPMSRG
jgi:PTS system nitrogen regulatory IIA component